ncbi:MAG TPA: hypothetical protein PKZ65_04795 [Methanoregulaceae archaeon]|nr:hypothetical protein [Methanoregulaceae archaeon]
MDKQNRETGEERPITTTILYGILVIAGALAAVVLVAKYAFNVDLLNFDQLLGYFVRRR